MLIESDLVFDTDMLTDMLFPDRVAVAKIESWMDGTTVTINNLMEIDAFHCEAETTDEQQYKTVNIYFLLMLFAALNVAPIRTPKFAGRWYYALIAYTVITSVVILGWQWSLPD